MKNTHTRQRLAFVICLLFIAVSLLSLTFVLEHSGHDCVGADCQVCLQLNTTQSILKQLGAGLAVAACFFAVCRYTRSLIAAANNRLGRINPTLLKVKLNN